MIHVGYREAFIGLEWFLIGLMTASGAYQTWVKARRYPFFVLIADRNGKVKKRVSSRYVMFIVLTVIAINALDVTRHRYDITHFGPINLGDHNGYVAMILRGLWVCVTAWLAHRIRSGTMITNGMAPPKS